jgi:uncharacterized Zn finger protein (UPF0148 family)
VTCGNCGLKSQHNKRTCRSAPKKTRQERAQSRDSDLSSNSDSDDEDDGSDQESLNSELSREAQWQAEMDYYDVVVARAKEIAERRRQEEVVDNDIQSDGTDTEGVELGDIEMGGIAGNSSLADQDGEDSQDDEDGQDGQDG